MSANSHWFNIPNPLTDHLPSLKDLEDVVRMMTNDPLEGLDISKLTFLEQDELLVMEKMPLRPTAQSLRTGLTISGMARGSLKLRNPTLASARSLVDRLVDAGQSSGLAHFARPQQGSATLLVMGTTGTSKTVTVKQACKLLGSQVIRHQSNEAALWIACTQLVFLYVGMSHDGSRGGLLTAILLSIDQALQTSYAIDMPKKFKSIDRLAGATISLLHSLYLGVLIIDESQLRNLVLSDQAELMQLFLLSLMNSGIPLVLVGNPFAFTWLSDFSQDARRLSEIPHDDFHPCGAIGLPSEDEWDVVFDGVADYYVLHKPLQDRAECSRILKRCSGGVPGLSLALWCTAQRLVLHEKERDSLEPSDIVRAYHERGFSEMRAFADGFANKDPKKLLRWRDQDVPVDYYADAWGCPLPDVISNAEDSTYVPGMFPASDTVKRKKPSSGKSKLKARATKEANQKLTRMRLQSSLSDEDMRKNGLQQHALKGLESILAKAHSSKKSPPDHPQ